MPRTVKIPPQFADVFARAEEHFNRFFQDQRYDPTQGTIEIADERYILVRGAAMSVEFFDVVKRLFSHSEHEATDIASQVLFDIAHALGKADANHFHRAMGLTEPISKLSAGPVFFSHTGWAFVDISDQSNPVPDENYYLIYDHPRSFEAEAWIAAGRHSEFPVCLMNAGYSSGWCEESFGLPLVAREVSCRARGDEACRFIMAPPSRIEAHVARHLGREARALGRISAADIGRSFNRDWAREELLEKTLHNSERDYRGLFIASPDAIFEWDQNGIVQAVNPSAATLLGYDRPEELIGRSWMDFVIAEDRQACIDDLRELEKAGGVSGNEFGMQRKDGSQFVVQGRVSVTLESGGQSRSIAVARDLTERKRREAEIERLNADLEQRVRDRTAELEAVNRDLETFAYSVSHDLRAPLRTIDGFSRILLEEYSGKLDAEGIRLLNIVSDGAKRMDLLVQDILSFSRIQRQDMTAVEIDMGELVHSVLHDLESAMAGRNVKVEVGPLPKVRGDAAMIRRVWTNLLDNAIKYTAPKERAVIEIGGRIEAADAIYVVKDNGVGFDMKHADQLFGVFHRLHGAEFAGTGIGLAIAKRVITRHGGRIWAEAKVNEGATFTFALPALDGGSPPATMDRMMRQ